MGTNCAPLLADIFLYSCENGLLKIYDHKWPQETSCYRYLNDLIVFNNKEVLD